MAKYTTVVFVSQASTSTSSSVEGADEELDTRSADGGLMMISPVAH